MAVKLIQHDLQFILDQIKVAEAHASGTPLSELISSPLLPTGLRTVDGSYNNFGVGREQWGASGQVFESITQGVDFVVGSGGFPNPGYPTNNDYSEAGDVVDAEPRMISNLIVDQTLDNPAAISAALHHSGLSGQGLLDTVGLISGLHQALKGIDPVTDPDGHAAATATLDAILEQYGVEMDGPSVMLPNVAPDEGLSASYNSFFTLFGQFFDHGLDLVAKGGNGTVYMPLSPDDPLYNPDSPHTNFMVMTRSTVGEGAGNVTTPWVDQNQTYTSNPSHHVFIREYEMVDGVPVATGRLLNGSSGEGLATWADVKDQARTLLGIELTDLDVTSVPVVSVDPYGNFRPGPNGLPQLVVGFETDGTPILLEGNLAAPVDPSAEGAARAGVAFLDDIAHAAGPVAVGGVLQADDDSEVGYSGGFGARGAQTQYDDELLDAHYITGDGRGNENIGLTAVHHVFHSEHNRMVEHIKEVVLQSGDLDFLNEWLTGAELTEWPAEGASLSWEGVRLFQAARFSTEMQYQHLVFEEFARKIQPDIDVFMVQPDAELNPVIFSEFANVVYRFGHSMLNETVDRINPDGTRDDMSLFDAFLNPLAFGSDVVDHAQAAGAIIRGMTAQVGNEIDEFVTNTLRNQLLGIPLDLPAINIARARDTGMPSLNEARAQFSDMAGGDSQLTPYESWTDFALNLKNPASIVNFIAAYGTHEAIEAETTLAGKRAIATSIVLGIDVEWSEPVEQSAGQIWTGPNTLGSDDANPLVDDIYYLDRYPDVAAAGADPDAHYASNGWTEGRDPNAFFSTAYYLETYPDIAAAGINPLEHYAQLGFAEGRNPSANFDGNRYLAENPDLPSGTNPLVHFLTVGRYEGREYYPLSAEVTTRSVTPPADRLDFLNGPAEDTGLNDVDLWMGGLAEKKMPFGGMLGSTFAFVFEMQLENLQDADRFYYLSRVQGLNLLTELENNSLAKMVLANTDLGETGFALPADIFSVPDHILYVDLAKQMQMTGIDDPQHDNPVLEAISNLVERGDGYIRYNGSDHLVIQGTDGDDHIVAGGGDDAVWGAEGNDTIEAGYGVDQINGGSGDDIITNSGTDIGETDMLKGEEGNDVIHGGSGLALIFGGSGKDFLMTGPDGSEIRAGIDDDFLLGGEGSDALFGNAGDDWVEGQGRFDYIAGDNGELFFNSTEIGHDVMNGGAGDTDYDSDSGDDIMFAGEGIQKSIGMWGHDWVIHKGQQIGADADMNVEVFTTLPLEVLRDRFSQVEAMSGWEKNDILRGDNRSNDEQAAAQVADPTPEGNFVNNELDEAGIARIAGLDQIVTSDLLGMVEYGADGSGDEKLAFTGGNILLGGGGSDVIEGRGGDDVIDGDAWLNVRISIRENVDGSGAEIASVDGMKGNVTLNGVTRPLTAWMLSGDINPGQLQIVREILHDSSGTDTAIYWADRDAYDIGVDDVTGRITVTHVDVDTAAVDPVSGKNRVSDGSDKLTNVEVIAFGDRDVNVVVGTDGNQLGANRLEGTAGDDIVIGLAGNDNLFGFAGDDALYGGAGADRLAGDVGDDYLDGGDGDDNLLGGDGNDVLMGGAGNDALSGQNGDDRLDGGAGDDNLLGGSGDDTLVWNAGGGQDMMNGQAGTDTALILGDADAAEAFIVYDATSAAANGFVLAANTEIAIVRDGVLIAELDNIEEIVIDGQGGGDTFSVVGNFVGTSLALSTITIHGSESDDSLDFSALTSAHRVVFKSKGGNDTVVGPMREQDSVEDVGDGTVTFVNSGSSYDAPDGPEEDIPTQEDTSDDDGYDDEVADDREVLRGTSDGDLLVSGSGRDMIFGGDGNDDILAGAGADMLFGDAGNDRIFAEGGDDYIDAGAGKDVVFGGDGRDFFVAADGDGDDVYYGGDMEGDNDIDTLDMSAIASGVVVDLGSGFMGRGLVISEHTGTDTIWGVENIVTGSGNDDIRANASVNVLDGGSGNDIFRFGSAGDADGDIIMGFQPGDMIDLSEIDADGCMQGDQGFTLVSNGFSGKGQLMVSHEDRDDGAYTVIKGNTTGDDDADFALSIKGTHQLTESHFTL